MEAYPSEQEAVLVLLERVGEAQRIATMQVRWEWKSGGEMRVDVVVVVVVVGE